MKIYVYIYMSKIIKFNWNKVDRTYTNFFDIFLLHLSSAHFKEQYRLTCIVHVDPDL
jgi:hypothetical protein